MKVMIPRFVALIIPLLLLGCAMELLNPLQKLQTNQQASGVRFTWPVKVSLPLGALSLSLDDPSVAKSLFGDLTVRPGEDERLRLLPEAKTLEPIAFADQLELPEPLEHGLPSQAIPAVEIPKPELALHDVSFQTRDLLPVELVPGMPFPYIETYPLVVPIDVPLADSAFKEAHLGEGAGRLTFEVTNRLGVTFTPSAKLFARFQGATREIGRSLPALPLAPGQKRPVVIQLKAGQILTRDLTIQFEARIPGGQIVSNPVDGLSLSAFDLDLQDLALVRVPLEPQVFRFDTAFPLELAQAGLATASVRLLEVEQGMLRLTLRNTFPVAVSLDLQFPGITRAGQSEPVAASYLVRGGETRSFDLFLTGATIRPENGMIKVKATASTADTRPEGALFAPDGSETFSGTMTLLTPFRFQAIEAPVFREVLLPASATPLDLPSAFTERGFRLEDAVLRLQILNQSPLAGAIELDVQASFPGKPPMRLTDPAGAPIRLPLSANFANELRVHPQNSNLLDILNAFPSELAVGGTLVIDSQGAPVRLTAADRLEGRVSFEVPLSLKVPAFGGASEAPAIEVRPPTPLDFAASNRDSLERVSRAVLKVSLDNGWGLPLDLDMLFSAQSDPFADAEAFVQTLALGDARNGYRISDELLLEGEALERFRSSKMLGMRLRSPGSDGPLTLFRGAKFRANLTLDFDAVISNRQDAP